MLSYVLSFTAMSDWAFGALVTSRAGLRDLGTLPGVALKACLTAAFERLLPDVVMQSQCGSRSGGRGRSPRAMCEPAIDFFLAPAEIEVPRDFSLQTRGVQFHKKDAVSHKISVISVRQS